MSHSNCTKQNVRRITKNTENFILFVGELLIWTFHKLIPHQYQMKHIEKTQESKMNSKTHFVNFTSGLHKILFKKMYQDKIALMIFTK